MAISAVTNQAVPEPSLKTSLPWYLVETPGNAERMAAAHLTRQHFHVYLPMRASLDKNVRKARAVPLFPHYLFIAIDLHAPRWSDIRSSIGVRSILQAGGKPAAAPDGLVESIRARERFGLVEIPTIDPDAMKRGDVVRISDGQFKGFDGVFDRQDNKRIMVLLSLFGRQSHVNLPAKYVRKAG